MSLTVGWGVIPEHCPFCGAAVDTHVTVVYPSRLVTPPLRSAKPNVRFTRWQCMAVMEHHNEVREPAE
jgi:hypothetical protein